VPELPEAETVRRQLEPHLVGQKIVAAWARLPRRTFPSIEEFVESARGVRIIAAKRRGKQIYFPLDNDLNLLVHLGMTGRLFIANGELQIENFESAEPQLTICNSQSKHVHAILRLDNGSSLVFADPRTFGAIGVSRELPFLSALGPEPLDADFDEAALVATLRKRSAKIKAVILDQKIVAGLGNIYADEVCFLARVHPAMPANEVPLKKLKVLVAQMKPVLERAIAARGATLKDGGYQDIFGSLGEYVPLAYGRAGEPCSNCGQAMQRGTLGAGKSARSYHFCPKCQTL
jgi:formamidopyrimidine-DNA glycosylase